MPGGIGEPLALTQRKTPVLAALEWIPAARSSRERIEAPHLATTGPPRGADVLDQVQLIGRLTRDPELGQTAGGKPVCDMRLAVPRRDREADPVYVDVIAYDVLAELCGEHLERGRQLAVTGRLDYQEWEARDGSGKRSKHSVVAAEVDFLARPNPEGSHEEPAAAAA